MREETVQKIVYEVYKISTKAAMDNRPLGGVVWIPPQSAVEAGEGSFLVLPCPPLDVGSTPPWEEN